VREATTARWIGARSVAAGGYIRVAAPWASPVSGTYMDSDRLFGPATWRGDDAYPSIHLLEPLLGTLLHPLVGMRFTRNQDAKTGLTTRPQSMRMTL
jgi:hypothetical protein